MEMPASTRIKLRWNVPKTEDMGLFAEESFFTIGWLEGCAGAVAGWWLSLDAFSTGGAGAGSLETCTGSKISGLLSNAEGWESSTAGGSGSLVRTVHVSRPLWHFRFPTFV